MEHERGAFKVNREMRLRAVKNGAEKAAFRPIREFADTLQRNKIPAGNLDRLSHLLTH
jgi:hypothetical protein